VNTRNQPTTNLPFIGPAPDGKRKSFWTIPDQGNYADGAVLGEAMAKAYQANMSLFSVLPPSLPQIVMDITGVSDLSAARQGQLVGFFSAIEEALRLAGA
jgi:hypothetical protein